MSINNIKTMEDITDEQVASLAEFAANLSIQNEEVIQLYANYSIMDPETKRILESESNLQVLANESPEGVSSDAPGFASEDDEHFGILSFPQEDSAFEGFWSRVKILFSGLKKKVRKIFCRIVAALEGSGEFDIKQIIKDVLLALIPALAATTGLMPIAVPIVVSLAAMLLRYGVSKVCPAQ